MSNRYRNPAAKWWAVGLASFVFGTACVVAGTGFAQPAGEKKETPKADGKKPAFDPKEVRVGPPPELAELREAVEQAARKGENVEEIRKKLAALETALAGKPWVKPQPAEGPQARRPAPAPLLPGGFPQPREFPGFQPFQPLQPDLDMVQKAQALLLKAAQLRADDPEKAEELMKEATELMTQALGAGRGAGRGAVLPLFPELMLPGANKGRLGVRIEKVPDLMAEEFKVPAGQGIRIVDVVEDSVAEKAGFRPDDVVIEFAGKPVTDVPADFVSQVRAVKAGQKVDVVVLRKGKKETIKGVELPAAADARGAFALPPLGGFPELRALDGADKKKVSVKVQNGRFTIDAEQDKVKYHMEGPAGGGKPVPTKITVTDGDKKVEAESVAKLPAEYRDRVQKILDDVKIEKK